MIQPLTQIQVNDLSTKLANVLVEFHWNLGDVKARKNFIEHLDKILPGVIFKHFEGKSSQDIINSLDISRWMK